MKKLGNRLFIAVAFLALRAASSVSIHDRELLAEMRQRRILAPEENQWRPEDYTTLLRVREAEALGAFDLLRSKLGTLRGFVVEHKTADGVKKVWLALQGYREFIFLKSQDARAYFEGKGAEARFVFSLRDIRGRPLFDASGTLTQEGDEVYNRVRRKLPVFWRYPDGRVMGNVRPPPEFLSGTAPAAGQSAASPASVQEAQAQRRVATLISSGYVEISPQEAEFLFRATKLSAFELQRESSLQIVAARQKTFYLISPSDPLMGLLSRRRIAGGPKT